MIEPGRPHAAPARLRGVVAGSLMAAASAVLALLLAEGALRIAGFEYHLSPVVEVGWPDPETLAARYADDPDLFWVTRDYADKLRAARRSHPTIVFLGDSCTEFGTYPAETIVRLATLHHIVVNGLHLAAGGWTSEQGVAQLRRDVVPLHPRVVVIDFGWNDHWIALGPTDPELRQARRFLTLTEHSRLAQLALKARIGLAARRAAPRNRVPPDRYRENLVTMAETATRAGIVPIFVTAPSNHAAGHEPAYLLRRHVRSLADVVPLHQAYLCIGREAARIAHAVLCDAAADFAALPSPDQYFQADGIHFTPAGDRQLGTIVSGCIASALGEPR